MRMGEDGVGGQKMRETHGVEAGKEKRGANGDIGRLCGEQNRNQ